jgi:hypothetical protein
MDQKYNQVSDPQADEAYNEKFSVFRGNVGVLALKGPDAV